MTTRTIPKVEYEAQLAKLRALCPPGSKVYTVLRHVGRSGMQRTIDAFVIADGEPLAIGWRLAKIDLGSFDRDRGGVKVSGCGMDMGFDLVYRLSQALYREGWPCLGESCRASSHFGTDAQPRTNPRLVHGRGESGYALNQGWV